MGIRDLHKNLLHINSITPIELNKITRNSIIFYDFGGLFYSLLNVSNSDEDFLNNIKNVIDRKNDFLLKENKFIVYFVDSGYIKIKQDERAKRSKTINTMNNSYIQKIFSEKRQSTVLKMCLNELGSTNDNTFSLHVENRFDDSQWNKFIDEIMTQQVVFIKVNNFDAEFGCVMMAKQFYRYLTIWPIILSHDQDTIGLALFNQPKDIEAPIIYKQQYQLVKSTKLSRLITFLTLIMNGSEYVKPIVGVKCTTKFIDELDTSFLESETWFDFDWSADSEIINQSLLRLIREIYVVKLKTRNICLYKDLVVYITEIMMKAKKFLNLDLGLFDG
jgi:hypothetical protein